MNIVPEIPSQYTLIRALLLEAFPTSAEACLVEQLRADGDAIVGLVALQNAQIAGHVMFSKMTAPFKALAMAPVAVAPPWRNRGVAARLIESGLKQARVAGWEAVFVLGDPAFYRRFGFQTELARHYTSPYAGPYLMGLTLAGDPLPTSSGAINHAAAFSAFG